MFPSVVCVIEQWGELGLSYHNWDFVMTEHSILSASLSDLVQMIGFNRLCDLSLGPISLIELLTPLR